MDHCLLAPSFADGINPLFFSVENIGNLLKHDARAVFVQLLQGAGYACAPHLTDPDWERVYEVS